MTNWKMDRLEFHEGFRSKIYICPAGFKTIGIGRNLETNPLTADEKVYCGDLTKGITYNQALYLLKNDIEKCEDWLEANIDFYKDLDIERKYALLDMRFQLGPKGLLGFKKMLAAMKEKNWIEAEIQCLDSKYAKKDTPIRAKRISILIRDGIWLRNLLKNG